MRKTEKHQYYTERQIELATNIVHDYTMNVLESLGTKALLVAYMMNPHVVAPLGDGSHVFGNEFWNNIARREGLEFDGNAGHTLLSIAKLIMTGYYDDTDKLLTKEEFATFLELESPGIEIEITICNGWGCGRYERPCKFRINKNGEITYSILFDEEWYTKSDTISVEDFLNRYVNANKVRVRRF